MNRVGVVIFALGIFIALVSGLGVFIMLLLSQPRVPETATTKLVVAFQNIPARSEIIPEQVGLANWPRAVPTPIGGLERTDDAIGKLAIAPIPPGQPITDKLLVDKELAKETKSTAALILEKGTVAIAMPVTTRSNVAEAIQAGDRVDIIVTFKSQSTTSSAVATQRLLSDVLILQVGPWPAAGSRSQSGSGSSVVTLQLKEQDAAVLVYTMDFASTVTLVLRPADDREIVPLEPVTFDYINQRYNFKLPK